MAKSEQTDLNYSKIEGKDMYEHFYRHFYKINSSMFEDLKYLSVSEMFKETHIVCFTDSQRVVGDLALEQSPYNPDIIWLKHVSVVDDFQEMGIASQLLDRCIEHIRPTGKKLELSSYSEHGKIHLEHIIKRIIEENPDIHIIESRIDNSNNSHMTL